jgi:hypothetical protein
VAKPLGVFYFYEAAGKQIRFRAFEILALIAKSKWQTTDK